MICPLEFYLSTHTGDRTTIWGDRYAEKTTNTPCIFGKTLTSQGYTGYIWAAVDLDGVAHTNTYYGGISLWKTYTTQSGASLYLYRMDSVVGDDTANVTITGAVSATLTIPILVDNNTFTPTKYFNGCCEYLYKVLRSAS